MIYILKMFDSNDFPYTYGKSKRLILYILAFATWLIDKYLALLLTLPEEKMETTDCTY